MNHVLNPPLEYINLMLDEKREAAARARRSREVRQSARRLRRGVLRRLRPAAA